MRVAFSHDWLNGMRGGEKCLEALCEAFPDSDIFTLFYEREKISSALAGHKIITSFLQRFPGIRAFYRHCLPFFPKAVETFRLEGYDLVISTSHCVAKGIRKNKNAFHLCYCFTPMRYAWGFFDEYFGKRSAVERAAIGFIMNRLKRWDAKSSGRVDHFVAISDHVKRRIEKYYHRHAEVVYPPADTDFFSPSADAAPEDFYLVVSALVPYKRVDLAVRAFNELGRRLVIIGDGPEKHTLQKMALANIQFLGWQPDETLRYYYRRARALIFPGEEDFGITPVEAQACGRFVIAYGCGGALETVLENKTGVFFKEPSAQALLEAVRRFETRDWRSEEARANALRFNKERFKTEMTRLIRDLMAKRSLGFAS
ncbi:MAG: glycosyltransferase [Candidatus Omnitrophica bacterium]|nr:glycosyltransferase [Candidatus Omnitrophota bacterium]